MVSDLVIITSLMPFVEHELFNISNSVLHVTFDRVMSTLQESRMNPPSNLLPRPSDISNHLPNKLFEEGSRLPDRQENRHKRRREYPDEADNHPCQKKVFEKM